MSSIDPTARIDKSAQIGRNVTIGPYCVIGPQVTIGDDCRLLTHVHVTGRTTIGARTRISAFTSLGTPPQSVHYKGEDTALTIGADCDIREHVTMNIGTAGGNGVTTVGDRCFVMVAAHVGHDCRVGNDVVFANNATLGGFVHIGDFVFLGGLSAVHQFTRIGEHAIIAGNTGVMQDIIPYAAVNGQRGHLAGLNRVGLKRRGFSSADIRLIYQAYRDLFYGADIFSKRLEIVAEKYSGEPLVMRIVDFIRSDRKRPLNMPRGPSAEVE